MSGRHIERVDARRAARAALLAGTGITYPADLPITERRDDLLAAIAAHPVVIVAGETGSGKSTQLPKLCLELGRGVDGMIGHTQPRRVAARTIAARVAAELGAEVGGAVGYSVRFNDRVGDRTLVKVMTDGILLAELQRDPALRRYDTLIIDEAHERSLNVDFLLGHLLRLVAERADLKVVVTSATIDTERFAEHFATGGVRAPVIEVTGRAFPVEIRYRPIGEDPGDERDQVQAVLDAVDELSHDGPGDVLVFFSGEREIHDTAEALRRLERRDTEVLPLYARLPSADQQRIFEPHRGRRIVLATNVAETSITVPGVRYVIDTGVARISRYSRRLKVQRLPIEPISQASADQRAGRCGRVGPGICVRLYGEDDHAARPEFTEPEILRTNLASVILQMTASRLGEVTTFPFIEPPDAAAIRDGYLLLEELAAVRAADDEGRRALTPIGRRLARLPVDPRLGRMILAAEPHGCVREVLVIAAALSIQDPRERPADDRERADEMHRRFVVAGSDLLGLIALWDHLRERQRHLSSNQFRRLCRAEHLNYLRVREWQDLFSQLRQVAGELGIRLGTDAGHPDRVHQALLSGLLSHVGMRDGESRERRDSGEYRGARGARFRIARDSALSAGGGRWVMAAELVETNRLWARRVATIQPAWAEQAGAHLVRSTYGEARWASDRGAAVTTETVTLYGLPIVSGRTVQLGRVDAHLARELFIRHALVEGDWTTHHRFVDRNREVVERVGEVEARLRRQGLVDDDTLWRFYDERVGEDVVSTGHFDRWWRGVEADDPHRLDLDERILTGGAALLDGLPDTWRHGELDLGLDYRFEPGHRLDGVTVRIPLTALNQIGAEGFDWHVPGYRDSLIAALARTLPKHIRRTLIPAAETLAAASSRLGAPHGRLIDALAASLGAVAGVDVPAAAFDPDAVPAHLRVHFCAVDDDGVVLDADDSPDALRTRLSGRARTAIAAASPLDERDGIVSWDVGDLPQMVEGTQAGHPVRGYPALVDDGDSVSLRVLSNPDLARRAMRAGVRRLLLLVAAPRLAVVRRTLDDAGRLALACAGVTADELASDCIAAAVDDIVAGAAIPRDAARFAELADDTRSRAEPDACRAMRTAAGVLAVAASVRRLLDELGGETTAASVADAQAQLDRLVRRGFVVTAGTARLDDVARYVRGIEYRVERLVEDLARDRRRMAEVVPLEQRYAAHVRALGHRAATPEVVDLGWQLEELRVSVFAQPIGVRAGTKVSVKRMATALAALDV